jgi:pimeloyl-ACP methyl ester carboxylesterase
MPTLQRNGSMIHYEHKGTGPLLVLLHAFPTDSRMWAGQLDELSSRYRVMAPDFPGFGKSADAGPFTVPSLAQTIRAFIQKAAPNSGKFVLGGLSMGGYVAMNYARQFPDDLRGLILADTKDAADNAEQRENRNRMIEVARGKGSRAVTDMMIGKMLSTDTESRRPAIAKALRDIMESCPAATIERALIALRDRPDMTQELAKIKTPTLIIVGDGDAITPPEVARGMQNKIAGSQLAVIAGAGHMSAMEQPQQVSGVIGSFMAGLDQT